MDGATEGWRDKRGQRDGWCDKDGGMKGQKVEEQRDGETEG